MWPFAKCNCKYVWDQDLKVAKRLLMIDFYKDIVREIYESIDIIDNDYFRRITLGLTYKGEYIRVGFVVSDINKLYIEKTACLACNTCLGYNCNIDDIRSYVKLTVESKYLENNRLKTAKEICKGG